MPTKYNRHSVAPISGIYLLRTKYITMTATHIYDELDFDCSFNNLRSILSGATYKNIPVYDKKLKTWVNKS